MPPAILVRPSGPLEGTVRVGGAKNSVLKLMAATLLGRGTYVLRNVPRITDVAIMAELLESMGVSVTMAGDALTDRSVFEKLEWETEVLAP